MPASPDISLSRDPGDQACGAPANAWVRGWRSVIRYLGRRNRRAGPTVRRAHEALLMCRSRTSGEGTGRARAAPAGGGPPGGGAPYATNRLTPLNVSPSNRPVSLILRLGMTSRAMKDSVMNGAESLDPKSLAARSSMS